MSEQFSPNSVRLSVTNSTPSEPEERFASTEELTFHPPQSDAIHFGRSPSNEVSMHHAAVSGQHARIVRQGENFFLEDMNSRNGTNLNDQRLGAGEKKLLRSGDLIRIVPFNIRFLTGMEFYNEMPPTENTAAIAQSLIDSVLGGVMGHEDTPPKLILMSGAQAGMQQFELSGIYAEFRIGRDNECDFLVQDENLSRKHAMFRRDPSGVYVSDLNSRNGVLINGRRLPRNQEHTLRDRDEITLGTVKLLFSDPEGAEFAEKVGELIPEPQQEAAVSELSIPQPVAPHPSHGDGLDAVGEAGLAVPPGDSMGEQVPGMEGVPEVGDDDLPSVGASQGEMGAAGESGLGEEEGVADEGGGSPEDVGGLTSGQVALISTIGIVVVLGVMIFFFFM